ERWLLVGPARMPDVRMYLEQGDHWTVMQHGSTYPMSAWALPSREPMFPLRMASGSSAVALLRVSGLSSRVGFTPQLWQPERYREAILPYQLLDGAVFGAMLLLVLASVALSRVFRRPSLLYLALAVLCYTGYVAVASNYAVVLAWPNAPSFNAWMRLLLICLMFCAANKYFCEILRVRQLGPYWHYLFVVARGAFLVIAAAGVGINRALAVTLVLGLASICHVLLTAALALGMWRRLVRSWFPPTLVALLWLQVLVRSTHALGGRTFYAPDSAMFSVTVLPGGVLLLLAVLFQIYKAQRRALQARAELYRQRESERARLEQQVAERTSELQRSLHARSTLLARISHDLRSPLAGIVDAVRQWRAGATQRDYSRMIERSATQQMALIDELLEYSRDELTELELAAAPAYLHGFLHDIAEQAQLMAERRDNQLDCQFAANLPAIVSADFRRLRQVLMNLLGNAAKFTQAGHIRFAVNALEPPAAGQVRLQLVVEDSGIGIAADERDKLLLPFTRGSNAARHEGSGLGLAIVTQLLQLMDSRPQIDEGSLGGTRFSFVLTLPLADEGELEPELGGGADTGVNGAGRTILVVDDQLQNRELLCDLLDGNGFSTLAAADGHAALVWLAAGHPVDLVLTDQSMPGLAGWGLLQAVRERDPDLPVVLYSALPPRRPPQMDAALSFTASLLKPAASGELLRLLVNILDTAEAGVPVSV
ncbi:MAG: ATP-binding protein, partial [Rhodanobacter sp.]